MYDIHMQRRLYERRCIWSLELAAARCRSISGMNLLFV